MGEASFPTGFLRQVLDAADRLASSVGVSPLQNKLREKLNGESLDVYRSLSSGPTARVVPFEHAEALFFAVDALLGDGSGTSLERLGQDLGNRFFVTRPYRGDLATCASRWGAHLCGAFEMAGARLNISPRSGGLEVFITVPGFPKGTRALRHLCAGGLRAAFTFAFEATSIELKIIGDTVGDRASIRARYRTSDEHQILPSTTPPARRSGSVPPPAPRFSQRVASVSEEVDRILKHAPGPSGQWRRPKVPDTG